MKQFLSLCLSFTAATFTSENRDCIYYVKTAYSAGDYPKLDCREACLKHCSGDVAKCMETAFSGICQRYDNERSNCAAWESHPNAPNDCKDVCRKFNGNFNAIVESGPFCTYNLATEIKMKDSCAYEIMNPNAVYNGIYFDCYKECAETCKGDPECYRGIVGDSCIRIPAATFDCHNYFLTADAIANGFEGNCIAMCALDCKEDLACMATKRPVCFYSLTNDEACYRLTETPAVYEANDTLNCAYSCAGEYKGQGELGISKTLEKYPGKCEVYPERYCDCNLWELRPGVPAEYDCPASCNKAFRNFATMQKLMMMPCRFNTVKYHQTG